MNCECIYWAKDTGKNKYFNNNYVSIAAQILDLDCELEPAALSVITKDVVCYKDYYDYGNTVKIPAGSVVLFVYGKYHYMNPIRNGRYVFHPYFPVDNDVKFDDITDCDDYNNAIKAHKKD